MLNLFKRSSNKDAKNNSPEDESLLESVRKPVMIGSSLIMFFVLTIFVWGGLAPLRSAAIAPGKLIISDKNKVIQHLEGGIITEMMVKDGDSVNAGQILLSLNDSESSAQLQILRIEFSELLANEIRLLAEKNKKEQVAFVKLHDFNLPQQDVQKIVKSQTEIFVTRGKAHQEQLDIIDKKIQQMQSEIGGLYAQKKSAENGLRISKEQLDSYQQLLEQEFVPKMKVMELEREVSDLEGRVAELSSEISKVKQAVGETKLSRINLETERYEEIITELKENQKQLADIKERMRAADDVLTRTIIKAPVSGVVTGLKHHTIGGVIAPGEEILQLVPENDNLIIEAMLLPTDIDLVHRGLESRVRLTAFKTRHVPMLEGKVSYVSADSFVDNNTGGTFYNVHVELNKMAGELEIDLQPGMPAEVYITTGEKTFLSYLMDPITDTMRKSFREE